MVGKPRQLGEIELWGLTQNDPDEDLERLEDVLQAQRQEIQRLD